MVDQVSDADYIKSQDLGQVIAKGMAVMFKQQPKQPVDFLAKWLLNYSKVERQTEDRAEQMAIVEMQIKQHVEAREQLNTEQQARAKLQDIEANQKGKFFDKIAEAHDLTDYMQDLTDHLQEYTNSSAVYIGKLVSPKKSIKDDDDDQAHVDDSSEKVIHFSHANKEQEFLVDKVLAKGSGLTFDVFNDKVDEDGKVVEQEDLPHVLVKEVVREPRIHFFKVPKLGSYLAIRLEYNSCLFVDAYNDGIRDALSCKERLKEQEEQKREHDEKEADRKLQHEADDPDTEYVRDDGVWPEIKPKPFTTQKIQYVVCLNTMGQDREFTEEEIRLALGTVKTFRDEWERIEDENLRRDVDKKLESMAGEATYRETNEALDIAEADKRADEATAQQEGQEPMDEFQKSQAVKKAKWDFLTKMFYDPEGAVQHQKNMDRERVRTNTSADRTGTPNTSQIGGVDGPEEKYIPLVPEYWKQPFLDMKDLNIMKMPRILQALFYTLQYAREEICERDTNKLDFKRVKTLINEDLFERMAKYNPFGQRESEYKEYQKLSFLKKTIESIEEEKVDEYSVILGRLHRWVTQALDLRAEDVRNRRDTVAILKHEREQAVAEDKSRTEKRGALLEEKQAEHETAQDEEEKKFAEEQDSQDEDGNAIEKLPYSRQEMNLDTFNEDFDMNNPPIDIPNEVADHIDNDFDLAYSAPDVAAE